MFLNRAEAAQKLGKKLVRYKNAKRTILLSLTRGGAVLGFELAGILHLPMDVIIVKKIGAPENREFALGAISEYGHVVINNDVVRSCHIPWNYIEDQMAKEKIEIEKQKRLYRENRAPIEIQGNTVILVDDGLATGYTMRVAIEDVTKRVAKKVVVAVPVGSTEAVTELSSLADEVICLCIPPMFFAVGNHYIDFSQVTDMEVVYYLKQLEKKEKEV